MALRRVEVVCSNPPAAGGAGVLFGDTRYQPDLSGALKLIAIRLLQFYSLTTGCVQVMRTFHTLRTSLLHC